MTAASSLLLKSRINVVPFLRERSLEAIDRVMEQLGLGKRGSTIAGVFDGKTWGGSGPLIESIDPSTAVSIAKIQSVVRMS